MTKPDQRRLTDDGRRPDGEISRRSSLTAVPSPAGSASIFRGKEGRSRSRDPSATCLARSCKRTRASNSVWIEGKRPDIVRPEIHSPECSRLNPPGDSITSVCSECSPTLDLGNHVTHSNQFGADQRPGLPRRPRAKREN